MIGNLKKYIDKASFMEHIDAKLRQNEPMIIDSFVSNKRRKQSIVNQLITITKKRFSP